MGDIGGIFCFGVMYVSVFSRGGPVFAFSDTGNTVVKAVNVLQEHNVNEQNIILLNLFCTPQGEAYHVALLTGLLHRADYKAYEGTLLKQVNCCLYKFCILK